MTIVTFMGDELASITVSRYFDILVGRIFKILPLRENNDPALGLYVRGLQRELSGLTEYIPAIGADATVLSILSILQTYADHPDYPLADLRRDVFSAIGLCRKMLIKYGESEGCQ